MLGRGESLEGCPDWFHCKPPTNYWFDKDNFDFHKNGKVKVLSFEFITHFDWSRLRRWALSTAAVETFKGKTVFFSQCMLV